MPTHRPPEARCHVHVFKGGLLSAVGHDLRLRVDRFEVEVAPDRSRVEATFDPLSVHVVCAMKDGTEAPETLSPSDHASIEEAIARDVLRPRLHPEIRFASTSVDRAGEGWAIEGDLSLRGTTRPIRVRSRPEEGLQVARVELHQPDFGIEPYRALLGTLKVKPEVEVVIGVPG